MVAAELSAVRTDLPVPTDKRHRLRYDWQNVPVGASFEFSGVSPQGVVASFGAHLAAGKYRIRHQGGGRYRFWRLG